MKQSRSGVVLCALLAGWTGTWMRAQAPVQAGAAGTGAATTVLKTTVRRVVLDVVVTDSHGVPVKGLHKDDFVVSEDGRRQKVLSFDANGFSPEMDYVPPALPLQETDTFIDLPTTPERGPLYVLLYDMTNMDSPDQMNSPDDHHVQLTARGQMMKFLETIPEGTRVAIFVRSDGLHLVEGFTSDKTKLYSALDPNHPRPHVPRVFLMGANFGRGDKISALDTLHAIAAYLDGLPGRKNVIWFSGQFPLSLFAADSAEVSYREETKATLDLLAQNQIAVYPVDARGVPLGDSHQMLTTSVHSDTITSPIESGESANGGTGSDSGASTTGSSPSTTSSFVQGSSMVQGSYTTMDELARLTGGSAFYGTNQVAAELLAATESGLTYYTLTYSPSNGDFNGKLRTIDVELKKRGYELSYRRAYYGTATPETLEMNERKKKGAAAEAAVQDNPEQAAQEALSATMQYGAPAEHQLLFQVHADEEGAAARGTPEQMEQLEKQAAFFRSGHKADKPLPPILLQRDKLSFAIPSDQFKGEPLLDLEIAAAVYDADGRMMNSFVRIARKNLAPNTDAAAGAGEPRVYRIEQEMDVPVDAATLRFAVRDATNGRMGAMETELPLQAAQ